MGSKINLMASYITMSKIVAGSFGFFTVINFYNGSEKFYDQIIMPVLNFFGPENTQKLTLFVNKYRLLPKSRYQDPNILNSSKLSLNLKNPIGITAKFDKNGDTICGLFDIGYAFVEIQPDPEDIKPEDEATELLTRTSTDFENIVNRIEKIRQNPNFNGIIGINLGRKMHSKNPLQDYLLEIQQFGSSANYLVIDYHGVQENKFKLETLLNKIKSICEKFDRKPLLLLKLTPNPSVAERKKVASIVKHYQSQIHGVIIPTAVENERYLQLLPDEDMRKTEARRQIVNCIQDMYRLTNGKVLIIGDGGVSNGEEAYENIRAGASYLQIYFPLILHGPPRITRIKKDLEQLLKADGFSNINEAVGIDNRIKRKHYFFPFY